MWMRALAIAVLLPTLSVPLLAGAEEQVNSSELRAAKPLDAPFAARHKPPRRDDCAARCVFAAWRAPMAVSLKRKAPWLSSHETQIVSARSKAYRIYLIDPFRLFPAMLAIADATTCGCPDRKN